MENTTEVTFVPCGHTAFIHKNDRRLGKAKPGVGTEKELPTMNNCPDCNSRDLYDHY